MNILFKRGIIIVFCLFSAKGFALENPNSSIDITVNGTKVLDHFEAQNAHKIIEKLDDAKIAFEAEVYNSLREQDEVRNIYYTDLGGAIQLQFTGSSNGIVNINFSGVSLKMGGTGEAFNFVDFDWDVSIENIQFTAVYDFVTGDLANVQLLNTYNIDANLDIHGATGFFIDLGATLGLYDPVDDLLQDLVDDFENSIQIMFESKYSSYSNSLFALDQVIPPVILFQGVNISPELISRIVAPLEGKSVSISTDLDISTNQTVTVNLWDDFIVTARRLKPIISDTTLEYLNCVGNNRQSFMAWTDTGAESSYQLQYKVGTSWYSLYSGNSITAIVSTPTGNINFRVSSLRGGVQGEWRQVSHSVPSCSGGGGGNFQF